MNAQVQPMSCPPKDAWLRLIDGQIVEDKAQSMRTHAAGCPRCKPRLERGEELVRRVAAPVPGLSDTVAPATKARLMQRIAGPVTPRREFTRLFWGIGFATAAVAAIAIVPTLRETSGFTARGTQTGPALAREVGVSFFAGSAAEHRLTAGDTIDADTPLVAVYRNVSKQPAYLLAVAVDAAGRVHWVQPGADTQAPVLLQPKAGETPLPETVVLDDPSPGTMRLLTVVSSTPVSPASLRSLAVFELTRAALSARFTSAVVEEFPLTLTSHSP